MTVRTLKTIAGIDCDDTDATVYLGATDAWYDGVDANCERRQLTLTKDGDGFMSDPYTAEIGCDD